IHMIKAEDNREDEAFRGGEAYCKGTYREYDGFGTHFQMLTAGFIRENGNLIKTILNQG
ncbi:MAG: hypothetical protein GY940_39885, partial [bacterium]|nr:hypothetical protein [bacterium]